MRLIAGCSVLVLLSWAHNMATQNPSFGFTDYGSEQADIERRRKYAEMLREQSMQPLEGGMAGGWAIPISPTQGFAKMLQAYSGRKGMEQAKTEQQALGQRLRTEATDWAAGMPQAQPAQPERFTGEAGDEFYHPATEAKTPSQQEMMSWALKGQLGGNPMAAQMATPFMAQALKQNEPFSLREGEVRFGAGGVPVANNPKVQPGFTLSPGQQRMGPNGQLIASLPESYTMSPGQVRISGGEPTATVSDANKPFNPDGTPNTAYQKYELSKANAGSTRVQTNVNAFTPASEEAQRDFIKSSRATFDQLKQAPVALQSIQAAKALIPAAKGFMGPGGETLLDAAKFLNNRVGTNINTEGVKSAEELRTRIFFNIMDNLKKMDAQPSQQQQMIMQEALGKLGTDPNALPAVLDAFGDVIKQKVQLHNTEVQSAIQRGVKFPYDPIIKMTPQNTGGNPKGVDPAVWAHMTDQEKALFK